MRIIMKTAISMAVIFSAFSTYAAAPVSDVRGSTTSISGGEAKGDVESRLGALERIIDGRNQMQFDIQQQLSQMQQEMNNLTGSMERQNYEIEQLKARQLELFQEMDKKQAPSAPSTAATPNQATSEIVAPENEKAAYEQAVKLVLQDKQYDEAIMAFQTFIDTYPDSSYGANAHYWLGQLLFNVEQREAAKREFDIVAKKYPDSSKRAEALLKSGVIAEYLGNKTEAVALYNQVISDYPGSASAKLAEPRVSALK